MTERRTRKEFRTAAIFRQEASSLDSTADELRAIAEAMDKLKIKSVDVDGVGKLERALVLAQEYLAKVDSALAIAKRMR